MQRLLLILFALTLLTGCGEFSSLLSTPEPATIPTSTTIPVTVPPPIVTPTETPDGPRILRIWIPPQFDPAAETPEGEILQERLNEFVARRPGLQIEVRIKTESMLDTLLTTQTAAPAIMPDLVALSRTDLESTSAQGLLHPLDGLTTLIDDPDWYPYAQQMAHIQNTHFGLPFAGDALSLIGYSSPLPTNWDELPEETLFIFPAADPQALFTLTLYLSAGGTLINEQGRPTIDETILAEVLSLYLTPNEDEPFLASTITEFQSNEEAWNAFLEQRGNLTVNLTSDYLSENNPLLSLASLPGFETGQFTLATGWSWALAGSNSENQALAIQLAEFLSESVFLAEWSQAAGYLPTRPTALSFWEDTDYKFTLAQTAESANLIPSQDRLDVIGPLFAEATLAIINGELLPTEAASSVNEQLK